MVNNDVFSLDPEARRRNIFPTDDDKVSPLMPMDFDPLALLHYKIAKCRGSFCFPALLFCP